jgi:hypothetical protein
VLVVPKILGIEEWSQQAMAYFASRAEAEAEDRRESEAAHALRTALPITTVPPFQPASYQPTMRNT